MSENNEVPRNYLLYDGECPFCSSISRYYRLKQALPNLQIVSMRDAETLAKLNLPPDLDFNRGMVLVLDDGRVLQGEPAFRHINALVDKTSLRDRIMVGMNSVKAISRIVYPVLFYGRLLVLKLKGVTPELRRVDKEKRVEAPERELVAH